MLLIALISLGLVLLTTLFHFAVLRALSGRLAEVALTDSSRILVMVLVAFAATQMCGKHGY